MKKHFITYQPKRVKDILKTSDYKVSDEDYKQEYNPIKSELNYNPIFFIPLRDKFDFFVKNFCSTPCIPEVMIITELDTYDAIDMIEWFKIKDGNCKNKLLKITESCDVEAEYIAETIFKNKVKKIVILDDIINNDSYCTIYNLCRDIKTKMLMYSQMFWDYLDCYFEKTDERDMVKFIRSNECLTIMKKYGQSICENRSIQYENIINLRNELDKLSKQYPWF